MSRLHDDAPATLEDARRSALLRSRRLAPDGCLQQRRRRRRRRGVSRGRACPGSELHGGRVGQGSGSGVIVSPDGLVLTNNHVIDGAQSISLSQGDGQRFGARLIGRDPDTDIAVLRAETTGAAEVCAAGGFEEAAARPDRDRDRQSARLPVDRDGRHHQRRRALAPSRERPSDRRRDPDGRGAQSRQLRWSAGQFGGPRDRHQHGDDHGRAGLCFAVASNTAEYVLTQILSSRPRSPRRDGYRRRTRGAAAEFAAQLRTDPARRHRRAWRSEPRTGRGSGLDRRRYPHTLDGAPVAGTGVDDVANAFSTPSASIEKVIAEGLARRREARIHARAGRAELTIFRERTLGARLCAAARAGMTIQVGGYSRVRPLAASSSRYWPQRLSFSRPTSADSPTYRGRCCGRRRRRGASRNCRRASCR